MSLTRAWAPHFLPQVRKRGQVYFQQGRVEQLPPEPGEMVRAVVHGSQDYQVTITSSDSSTLKATCNCPFFSGGSYCKHIWAVVLFLQNHGRGAGSVQVLQQDSGLHPPKARRRSEVVAPPSSSEPEWLSRLSLFRSLTGAQGQALGATGREVCYVVHQGYCQTLGGIVVELQQRQPVRTGWSRLKPWKINRDVLEQLPDPLDRELCGLLLGAEAVDENDSVWDGGEARARFRLTPGSRRALLHRMIDTGRCLLLDSEQVGHALSRESDVPWLLCLVGELDEANLHLRLELRRGEEKMAISQANVLAGGRDGVVIYDGKLAPFDDRGGFRWVTQFRERKRHGGSEEMLVPRPDIPRLLERLYDLSELPDLCLPEGVGYRERDVRADFELEVFSPRGPEQASGSVLSAALVFDYGGRKVDPWQPARLILAPGQDEQPPTLIRRDQNREQQAVSLLLSLGFRCEVNVTGSTFSLPARLLPQAAGVLLEQQWKLRADQKSLRHGGQPSFTVSSGIDWFELHGGVHFQTERGLEQVSLPQILTAARAGKSMITLSDGSQGIIPEQWLRQHGLLTGIGQAHGDHLRFARTQAVVLDALLEATELVDLDEQFQEIRLRLRHFQGIAPGAAAPTFQGTLRSYQCDGLGWLEFLRMLGLGGILADDMGLGKTIQVLAMLDDRYPHTDPPPAADRPAAEDAAAPAPDTAPAAAAAPATDAAPVSKRDPTLIVVPRSVVFNWIDEATRFAPQLKVQAYTGAERRTLRQDFQSCDVIVTTYGLLRRDIAELRQQPFDYVVLDEAQAIKNPKSQSARAARLLKAKHRLALTGTPVENHLGDLWSIFDFLNPGMLGPGSHFAQMLKGGVQQPASAAAASQAGKVLRPLILRRTKKQVLDELPEKTEQTILCEMEPEQRGLYDQLLRHYRSSLMRAVDDRGMASSTMMVLEALLRLRQAACHPGLIDPARQTQPSAKLEELSERLVEMIDEGHKALVFSQFTSMLAIVRQRLDQLGIVYEYLDGQTRQRKARVERFQNDAKCPVFLISLKAGGLGLNLTAADYVFILDPWWNPAVESQAIDRAHRIGQSRHVFAYRLICENTVEQRIADLQDQKRALAQAIVGEQSNVLRNLTREDLEKLLS